MMNISQSGKPGEGMPSVMFDEADVASKTSRCGLLPLIGPACLCLVALGVCGMVQAEVFPAGTTVISTAKTYTSGEELSLTNEAGTTVEVVTGGSIAYDAGTVTSAKTPVMTIGSDSELKLTGSGSVTFSDFAGLVSAQGTEDHPAKITIGDTGHLTFAATRNSNQDMLGAVQLGPHVELDVSGSGIFETSDQIPNRTMPCLSMFSFAGGRLRFRDSATFKLGYMTSSEPLMKLGAMEFSDSSVLDFTTGVDSKNPTSSVLMIGCGGGATAGDTMELVFKDHARTETGKAFNVPGRLTLANRNKMTWTYLRHYSDQTISLGAICYVGVASSGNSWKGGATYEQTNGYAQVGGNCGLHVAHVADGTTQVCTGIVSFADCGFTARANLGGAYNSGSYNKYFTGIIIGRGPAIIDTKTYAVAEMRIAGTAAVTNTFGYVAIGTGRSTARVIQTGGSLYSQPVATDGRPITVGLAGGTGEWLLSNGVINVMSDLYIGGAPVATSHAGVNWRGATGDGKNFGADEDYTIGGAVGTFVVAAEDKAKECTLLLTRKNDAVPGFIYVGANGTGSLEVGEGGYVNCRGLTLAGPTATLKFSLGATGLNQAGADTAAFMRIKASAGSTGTDGGLLQIGSGAKLVVDARNYTGSTRWVLLILPNRREGAFAPEDITVLGPGEVCQDRPGYTDPNNRTGLLWYHRCKGTVLTVR